jgi:DNA-binding Lrp family transcriptional regulator
MPPKKILQTDALGPLDRTDRAILAWLQHDARITNKALAEKVKLAPSSCLTRVQRLEERGVIQGYHAEVDPRAYGVTLEAQVSVRLARHARAAISAFEKHLDTISELRMWYHVAGVNDYLVHVAVRDAEHLRQLVLSAFASRREVGHVETALVFSHRRNVRFGIGG